MTWQVALIGFSAFVAGLAIGGAIVGYVAVGLLADYCEELDRLRAAEFAQ